MIGCFPDHKTKFLIPIRIFVIHLKPTFQTITRKVNLLVKNHTDMSYLFSISAYSLAK